MRRALLIGVDHYEHRPRLHGCVEDAIRMEAALERHASGAVNFGTKLLTASSSRDVVTRQRVRAATEELFAGDLDVALFYFAGHGDLSSTGGHLISSECAAEHEGISLTEIMTLANSSSARNKLIILDSCHSGAINQPSTSNGPPQLAEGLTVLSASTKGQYANEVDGLGVFTSLFVDALNGSAANLVGEVTPGTIYAHIDKSLGPWEQRPVFMTNVTRFVSLKTVQAPIPLEDLRRLAELFPVPGYELALDPSFEPESDAPSPANTSIFAVLQKYNRVGLLVPVGAQHLYYAAMDSKACRLTALGEHYRTLVAKGRI